jgi:predicted RNA-binding protein YlxR (DUF448 family)
VRTPEGSVQLDPSGKKAGRGAYLCRRRSCWMQAFKRGSLEGALKAKISEADAAVLQAFAEALPADADVPADGAENEAPT